MEYAMRLIESLKSLSHRRAKDYVLYVVIATLIIGAAFAMLNAGLTWDSFVKWVGLSVATATIGWYFIADSRTLWGTKSFWALTVVYLSVHCLAWIVVLLQVQQWKFIWFAPMIVEVALLLGLRSLLDQGNPAARNSFSSRRR